LDTAALNQKFVNLDYCYETSYRECLNYIDLSRFAAAQVRQADSRTLKADLLSLNLSVFFNKIVKITTIIKSQFEFH